MTDRLNGESQCTLAPTVETPIASIDQLARALCQAQAACKAVGHDKRNDYHRYDYTSAEAIIAEGKKALAANGLALLPVEQTLTEFETHEEARYELTRKFLLLHSTGQSMPLLSCWPVCPEKGRPLDKACAAAATLSLAYTLRDLLLMPRVEESDDVASRDDRPERINAECVARLEQMIAETKSDMERFKTAYGVAELGQMTMQQYEKALEQLERKRIQQLSPP